MSRFTPETVERVKDAADIVEIVSAYTELRRAGDRYTGLCPFHDERTPSFSVNLRDKLYYCFGCEAGGDVFRFVQEKEGLGFPEAVEALAERYGVELQRDTEDPRAEEARKRRARLGELLERTAQFFATYLWESAEAAKARAYLQTRGLSDEVLRAFGVGYAPSAWDQVLTRGQRAGFTVAELAGAGLVQRGRQGGHYDRFRARITFPVRDTRGRMQGFGARALRPDSKPKYLNSPEGELYRKGRTLYGIDRARGAIAKRGRAVVVEGYTDVLAAHQGGIEEAVAVMGTAITPEQLQQLSPHADRIVLAMDADRAGQDAMLRVLELARQKDIRLQIAPMPKAKDPADLLSEGGNDRFRALLDDATDVPTFQVETVLGRTDLGSPQARDHALDELASVLAALDPDSVEGQELTRYVADRINADPSVVARRVERRRGAAGGGPGTARPEASGTSPAARAIAPQPLSVRERRERALLAMCVASPREGREFLERLTPEYLSSPLIGRAKDWLAGHLEEPLGGLPREDEELVSLITQLVMRAEREPGGRAAMELNFLQLEQAVIEGRIDTAQREGGDPPVKLQRRRAEIAERIAHWETAEAG